MKICRDCKYYQGNWDISDKCMHPEARTILMTDGSTYPQSCSWVRTDKTKCGPDASWFVSYEGNRNLDDFIGSLVAVIVIPLVFLFIISLLK